MKEYLERLHLVDYLQLELEMQKNKFEAKLMKQVDKGSLGIFADSFDIFSSSKNVYKGEVGNGRFRIKKRRRFFDVDSYLAIASGSYSQKDDRLIIEAEINGFSGGMIPFFIFLIVFYTVVLGIIFVGFWRGEEASVFVPLIILLHAALMIGIPYFLMKNSTKRLKRSLEKDFYYMTKPE